MNQTQWKKVSEIVDTALDLKAEERSGYIKKECKGDLELKHEVTDLLESIAESQQEEYLENPGAFPGDLALDVANSGKGGASSLIGETIGNYKILELIGHGGMGSVFLTERVDGAYDEKVALKLLRRGMDTPSNIARFRRERNILASLNHPNIAHLLDGGITDDGLPYLVMEYVDGIPLLEYCNNQNLSVQERLSLFKSICSAVEHAHKNATIHRDLKPSNIFISEGGTVKILDFGIAKLVEPNQQEDYIIQTRTNARILTMGYAAPEQFEQQPITTATDIYTMGILLYELLVGVRPFDLGQKSLPEIESIIRNEEPKHPSKKFKLLSGSKQVTIAGQRSISPNALVQQLKGDLDAIVMKALRTEPEARYSSVEQLLDDLNRYHQSRPLVARSDTFRYRFGKFMSRNRKLVVGGLLMLISVVGFASYHVYRITEERNIAEIEARKARSVKNFLIDIFRASNPRSIDFGGRDLTARQLLMTGKNTIDNEFKNQPDVHAEILLAIGDALKNIDAFEEADKSYQSALDISAETSQPVAYKIQACVRLGWLHTDWREQRLIPDEYARRAHDLLQQVEHPSPSLEAAVFGLLGRVHTVRTHYKKGNRYFSRADSIYISSGLEQTYEYITMLTGYGRSLLYDSDFEQSYQTLRKSNRLHRERYDRPTLTIAENYKYMGWSNRELGNFDKSNAYFRKSIELKKKLTGDRSFQTAIPMYHLSRNYLLAGDYEKSEELARKVLGIYRDKVDPGNQFILQAKNYIAIALYHQQKFAEAEKIFQEVIGTSDKRKYKAMVRAHLAMVYQQTGRFREAVSILQNTIHANEEIHGAQSRGVAVDMVKLAAAYREMGQLDKARKYFERAESILKEKVPEGHYRLAELHYQYARLHLAAGDEQQARHRFKKACDIYQDCFGPDSPRATDAQSYLEQSEHA